jgi:hypothetical protein
MVVTIDMLWRRIIDRQGETFRQQRGQEFTYRVRGDVLVPSTTKQNLPKSQFAAAAALLPLQGPGEIQHLRGPSYLYAILTDPRICPEMAVEHKAGEAVETPPARVPTAEAPTAKRPGEATGFCGHAFAFVAWVEVERDAAGRCVECMPQDRYAKRDTVDLHAYGQGPFCCLVVPELKPLQGVYAIVVDGEPKYIGICADLSARFGSQGYARIQPANCYDKGQRTNCRINHLLLHAARREARIGLWFHQSPTPGPIERHLLKALAPEWNIR